MQKHKFFLIYVMPFLLVGLVLIMGLMAVSPRRGSGGSRDERLVMQILQLINEHYVEPIGRKDLSRLAIRGMVNGLDRYSDFLDVEASRAAEEDNRGRFGGLGVHLSTGLSLKNQALTVLRPFRKGPAIEAGILPGDRVVAVNGEALPPIQEASDVATLVRRIKGEVGSRVRLTVERDQDGKTIRLDKEMTRAQVQVDSVLATRMVVPEAGIGYLRIDAFKERTVEELDEALDKLLAEGLEGLILDLRNNGGGLLRRAAQAADRFLSRGEIVRTRGRHPEDNESLHSTPATKVPPSLPVVVLINRASASASEAMAGALQDYRRALLVGDRSYGKGVVQSVYKMGRTDTSLKITTSRYYTPAGRCIDRIYTRDRRTYVGGIIPDVLIMMTKEEDDKVVGPGGEWEQWLTDEVDSRTPPPPALRENTTDRQLLAAIDLMRGKHRCGLALPRGPAGKKAKVRRRKPEVVDNGGR